MLAYPVESQKGLFIGVFWAIFNLGAVVGAAVSLGQNFNSKVLLLSFYLYIIFQLCYSNRQMLVSLTSYQGSSK